MYGFTSSAVNFCTRKRRRSGRNRLRRPGLLARHVTLRHGPFFDGPQRLAGHAIEHVEETGLARHRHGIDSFSLMLDRDQLGRRRVVVVPQIMMNGLEVPQPLPGPSVEREQAVAEKDSLRVDPRRKNRTWRNQSGSRRCRASHRPRFRPRYLLRRRMSRRLSSKCRSQTRRDAGMVWNCHTSAPVITSYARKSPGGERNPSPVDEPCISRLSKIFPGLFD